MVTKEKQNRLKKKTQIYYETGYSVAVCDRHNLELKMLSVFGEKVDNVLDFAGMEDTAERFIAEHKEIQKKDVVFIRHRTNGRSNSYFECM